MSKVSLSLKPGKYVAAVSGGVDSMVLLDLLSKVKDLKVVVAHFNHGIRRDSGKDERLVAEVAKQHKLPLEVSYGNLGPKTSEDRARQARYAFLCSLASKHSADTILTGHHEDDLIETIAINLMRGTGHRGISAIALNPDIKRPLLNYPKSSLLKYAKENHLVWHEDPTNLENKYLRNYLRNKVLPNLSDEQKAQLIKISDKVAKNSKAQNELIATISHVLKPDDNINRRRFTDLPVEVADELLVYWLREQRHLSYERSTISRLNMAIRTAKPATRHSVGKELDLVVGARSAYFERRR